MFKKNPTFSLVYFKKCGKSWWIGSLLRGVVTKSGNHLSYFDILASPLTFVWAFCQAFEGHIDATEPQIQLFFFSKEAWTFHDHIRNQSDFTLVMQYVMFQKKNLSRLKSAVCSVVVSFPCLLPLRGTRSAQVQQKMEVGKGIFVMLCCFLPLFCSPFLHQKHQTRSILTPNRTWLRLRTSRNTKQSH